LILPLCIAICTIVFLELLHRRERDDWRIERQRLLTLRFENRQTTPIVVNGEDTERPWWVAPDDDKAHYEAVKERL
jgi:hypothetical protein